MPPRTLGQKPTRNVGQIPWREMVKQIPRATRLAYMHALRRRLSKLEREGHIILPKGVTLKVSEDDLLPCVDDGVSKHSKSSSRQTEEEQEEAEQPPTPIEPAFALVPREEILQILAALEKRPFRSHIGWAMAHTKIAQYKNNPNAAPDPTYKRILALLRTAAVQHESDWGEITRLMDTVLCDQSCLTSSKYILKLLRPVCRLAGVSTSLETHPSEWDGNLRSRLLDGNWSVAVRMDRVLSLWDASRQGIGNSRASLWMQFQEELRRLRSVLGTDGQLHDFADDEIHRLEVFLGESEDVVMG